MGVRVKTDLAKLNALQVEVRNEVSAEVALIALDLHSESVRLAPVDEGTLRGSGAVHVDGKWVVGGQGSDPGTPIDAGADNPSATVSFNTTYAVDQHENTDYAHPKGGQAKYLEEPLERNRPQYEDRLARAAGRKLR